MKNSFKNGGHREPTTPCEIYNKDACNDYGKNN